MGGHDVVLLFEIECNPCYSKVGFLGSVSYYGRKSHIHPYDNKWESDNLVFSGTYVWIKTMRPWKIPLEINVRAKYGNLRPA